MHDATLRGRSVLGWLDWTTAEIKLLLDIARKNKIRAVKGRRLSRFSSRTMTILSGDESRCIRLAFESAFTEEGGHTIVLGSPDFASGKDERVEDLARIAGRMTDCILYGGADQQTLGQLATYASVPVYSAGTAEFRPVEALADVLTLAEERKTLSGSKLAFVGDGRSSMAASLLSLCPKIGIDITIIAPAERQPSSKIMELCLPLARDAGTRILVTDAAPHGVLGADVVYSSPWIQDPAGLDSSVPQLRVDAPPSEPFPMEYQVDATLMEATGKSSAVFMHCQPMTKGREVSLDVVEGFRSRVFRQAENRKHVARAILLATLQSIRH